LGGERLTIPAPPSEVVRRAKSGCEELIGSLGVHYYRRDPRRDNVNTNHSHRRRSSAIAGRITDLALQQRMGLLPQRRSRPGTADIDSVITLRSHLTFIEDPSMSAHGSIQSVAMRFIQTWNSHDMDAFALLFREDADFVNVYGSSYVGRQRIRDEHISVHATVFRESQLSANEMRIKQLADTVASLQMHWALTGIKSPSGQPLPDRKGILTLIVIKTSDGWEIAVGQNTDIVPTPA
jgi:uncharacterized protein (TIGR02246 family)